MYSDDQVQKPQNNENENEYNHDDYNDYNDDDNYNDDDYYYSEENIKEKPKKGNNFRYSIFYFSFFFHLEELSPREIMDEKLKKMAEGLCEVLDDVGLISFIALNIQDGEVRS